MEDICRIHPTTLRLTGIRVIGINIPAAESSFSEKGTKKKKIKVSTSECSRFL